MLQRGEGGRRRLARHLRGVPRRRLIKQTDDHTPAIAAPEGPLATPSGKYEVFSKQAYNLSRQWDLTGGGYVPDDGRDQITGLPIWYENFEGYGDPLREEYPFQLIGHHTKTRTHSSYGNVPWMSSVAPQQCWINEGDAATLGNQPGRHRHCVHRARPLSDDR